MDCVMIRCKNRLERSFSGIYSTTPTPPSAVSDAYSATKETNQGKGLSQPPLDWMTLQAGAYRASPAFVGISFLRNYPSTTSDEPIVCRTQHSCLLRARSPIAIYSLRRARTRARRTTVHQPREEGLKRILVRLLHTLGTRRVRLRRRRQRVVHAAERMPVLTQHQSVSSHNLAAWREREKGLTLRRCSMSSAST